VGSNGSERRPRIGLTTYLTHAEFGVWQVRAAVVPEVYLHAVAASGGVPVLLPPVGSDPDLLDVLDGLLLIGGVDLDPQLYGEEPHLTVVDTQPDRDTHEASLFHAALDRRVPVLGVCRGAQLMTAALGGTLHQHLPDVLGHERHRPEPAVFGTTTVTTKPDSLVAEILGEESKVPCYHHQGLRTVETPLEPTAWADDGLVEAVELPGPGWVLGVQWHPEENPDDLRLFAAHVEAARSREGEDPAA
jgi:gamma-glutamyl-gamma-aminobutyrate hydrolase PuuD